MVTVDLVQCVADYLDFKKGELYLHKISNRRNHVVKFKHKWIPIISPPMLIVGYQHKVFNRCFLKVKSGHTNSHYYSNLITIEDFEKVHYINNSKE